MHWYTLNSHPNKEEALFHQVQMHSIEAFYPSIRVTPVNPRARKMVPYFPGYLFVHVDLQASGTSVFQWMPYARGLVGYGGEPALVPESLVGAIQRRVREINAAGGQIFEDLRAGEKVMIQAGPFAGYDAIFDARLPGSERVRVLLKMLSKRELPLELNVGQIQRKKILHP